MPWLQAALSNAEADGDLLAERDMAIALQPKFPVPDRSKQPVRRVKNEEGEIDIGWCDGVLSDGRAFRAEMWAQDQISVLTIFFSVADFPDLNDTELMKFVETERLCKFKDGSPQHCSASKIVDDAGRHMWTVNVAVGNDEETFISGSVPIYPYSKIGEPNTMLNPVPIAAAWGSGNLGLPDEKETVETRPTKTGEHTPATSTNTQLSDWPPREIAKSIAVKLDELPKSIDEARAIVARVMPDEGPATSFAVASELLRLSQTAS